MVFASTVVVVLIDQVLKGLQSTIKHTSELQERYKNIFDKSPLPMWLFDIDTLKFIDVNEAAIRQYGYAKDEFLSMTIMDIRTAEKVPEIEALVKTNKLSGSFYDGNSKHIKKNGEAIYVKIESNKLHLDSRQVRLVLATDITAQMKYQLEISKVNAKIKQSESNLRAIFESSVDGFVLLDTAGVIKVFNPKASDSMRFNKNHGTFEVGRSIFEYVEGVRLRDFHQIIDRVYSGETINYERRHRGKDARETWIRYTLTPVWEDNAIIGACITGRDVTDRKLYLKSVEDQNKTFREISWMQSHLVRAPLARIMGLMPLFRGESEEQERVEIVNYLSASAKELDDIIIQITEKSSEFMQKYPEASA